ncbi:Dolichyl-phosphate-mannose-protein mannosyltransferase [Reichenbachiella agariperforans]|uniref:Dolichyl-phosphate-mannose-protein mannosyltransferase n=1 Tax=Reichenbachiella agariperforans TaxID=156994 RepID=A0A1M6VVP4_REIAG|nr:glycosyltransferase family 39 protein [Reichenbachiella agariperforans]SHK85533.1 Dolichyl-phosphate-mannose-protein mannosyltransferase [Reichenbachiella agariperforans]
MHPSSKKYLPIILTLSGIKLLIQCLGNQRYGFHRDELLHLSVSEHLDWGFMEFPPLIALLGKLSYLLFDYALWGVRLFPTLAGVGILILCCLMALELGGKLKAVVLAGVSILSFLPFYRNHTLFQPVAFDQLFWTLGFYFVIKFINSPHKKHLLAVGITLGLGLMTKYTLLVWAFSTCIGLLFYERGRLFRYKWLYLSACLSLVIFLPNVIWQVLHDYPILKHLQALNQYQLDDTDPIAFGMDQLEYPFTLVVSLIGVVTMVADQNLKKYRAIGVAVLVIFTTMWLLHAKAYYVFAIYPALFAAGAVKLEALLTKKPALMYIVSAIVLLPSLYFIPQATPILPIDTYVKYAGLKEEKGRIELTGDYADMFGWEEQVQLVDSVYRSLTPIERQHCVLWAENYGEAGALKILGKKYQLPDPISRHGSFWTWGYGDTKATVWISLGNEKPAIMSVFEEVKLIKTIIHPYAIAEENNIPLYLCRKPKVDIDKWWRDYEAHIFD